MYIYTHICTRIHTCILIYIHKHKHTHTHTHTYTHTHYKEMDAMYMCHLSHLRIATGIPRAFWGGNTFVYTHTHNTLTRTHPHTRRKQVDLIGCVRECHRVHVFPLLICVLLLGDRELYGVAIHSHKHTHTHTHTHTYTHTHTHVHTHTYTHTTKK